MPFSRTCTFFPRTSTWILNHWSSAMNCLYILRSPYSDPVFLRSTYALPGRGVGDLDLEALLGESVSWYAVWK